jgi:hypothetical protein
LIFYSYICLLDGSFGLCPFTVLLELMNQLSRFPFTLLYTWVLFSYMHCVFVHATEYFVLVCSVMWVILLSSKYSLEILHIFKNSGVPWLLYNWTQTGGTQQEILCAVQSFAERDVVKIFRVFYQILRLVDASIRLSFYLNLFHSTQLPHELFSSTAILILYSRLSTSTPTALHPLRYISGKLFFLLCKDTHFYLYLWTAWIKRNFFFFANIAEVQVAYFTTFSLNISQVPFMGTKKGKWNAICIYAFTKCSLC